MNLFNSALVTLVNSPQKRSAGDGVRWPLFGLGATTNAGKKINSNSSLKISAFWCGVNNIANSLALLPKHVMLDDGKTKERIPGNEIDFLIHKEPNNRMTAYSFWFSFAVSMLLKGNGYALITRNGAGVPVKLTLWDHDKVTVIENDDELYYRHSDYKTPFHAADVYHVPNFCINGVTGRSALQYAADNLGVSIAADEYAAGAYSDKGVSYGVIEVGGGVSITPSGQKALKSVFEKNLEVGNKHRTTVLDEGMKYKSIALTPAEAEFIKAKAQGVEDIARWLNIPLHKLHAPGEGGYNYLVQMSIEYLQSAVIPLGQKIKEEAQRKLIGRENQFQGQYIFMNYRKLLEADPKARAQYYKDMTYIKAINPNEVRALEDMNSYAGGDEFLQMTNLQTQAEINKDLKDG